MKHNVCAKVIVCLMGAILLLSGCGQSASKKGYINESYITKAGETIYETTEKHISWGAYQKNEAEIGDSNLVLECGYIGKAENQEMFTQHVTACKNRIDILKSDYAFAFSGEDGDYISVKIDDAKMGLPVIALLNLTNPYRVSVVSQLADMEITGIANIDYTVNASGKYEIKAEIPASNQEELAKYMEEHPGEMLFLKLGDLTFSRADITAETTLDNLVFTGLLFLGNQAVETDYAYIMELAEYVVENPANDMFYMTIPFETDEDVEYKVPYIMPADLAIAEVVNGLYEDAEVTRTGIKNEIKIKFNIDPETVSTFECLNRIYHIYNDCNFDNGNYSVVAFVWPSAEQGKNNYVIFTKKDGKMVCTGYADAIKQDVEQDNFINRYIVK